MRNDAYITAGLVFLVSLFGYSAAFAIWGNSYAESSVTILGSGSELSILVNEGRSRVLLASGNDPVRFSNAFTDIRPIFARRVDVLVAVGEGDDLLVPIAARDDQNVRETFAIGSLPPSAESTALAPQDEWQGPKRIQIGPTVTMTIEPIAATLDGNGNQELSWRATIERGSTRVVVLSDGGLAERFAPGPPASVLVVSGAEPAAGWAATPAIALVANASRVDGPELRSDLEANRVQPRWTARVFPGESLRLRFIPEGISVASDAVQQNSGAQPNGP
ncbi:MAG: hypothetical protein U0031_14770 [Thermomicrobiales bacterium]